MRFPRLWLASLLAAVLLSGCGVNFHNAPKGTEFFKSLTVSGDMKAGSTLSASLRYAQHNPKDVQVSCELRQGSAKVKDIGLRSVPALPDGGPDATPVADTYDFQFTVDAPGSYKAECFTPADEDNFIIETFTVS